MKKITFIALVTIIAVSFMHGNGYAESEDDLKSIQEKRENIQEDLSEKEMKSEGLISEIKNLNKEIQHGNAAIEEKEALIENTEQDITDTIQDIHALQDDIQDLEADSAIRYDILKERLASYQKSGGRINYLDVVFGADDFSDFTSRVSLVTKITDSDAALMEQIEKNMENVEKKQELALDKLDELNDVQKEQENALASIDEERRENEERIENLKEKQQALIESREALELEDSDLASLEKETKKSIAAANAAAEAKEKAEQQEKAEKRDQLQKEEKSKSEEKEKAVAKEKEKKQSQEQTLAKKTEHKNPPKKDKTKVNEKEKETASNKENNPETNTNKNKDPNPEKGTAKSFTVTSTAYTATCNGCSGFTTTGIDLNKHPDKKVIAVDPDVIPLGSIVWVEGYGYAVAGDTGGAINGKKIDVFVSTKEEAYKWGVRTVKVKVQ